MIVDNVTTKYVNGYDGLYAVDIYGNVYSFPRKTTKGGILKPQLSHGHHRVALTKEGKTRCFFVHRLVAEAFIPNPNNYPQVNHKDECKTNNFVDNLEWCTAKYNSNYGTGIKRNADARRGVPLSPERKRKISEKLKGHPPVKHTDAGRKKMSEAAKLRWEKWRANHGR